MKVLHLVPTYLPANEHGGPIASVHALNKALVQRGADITVYTTNINMNKRLDVPLGEEVNLDGVKVFYFPTTFRPWEYSRAMHSRIADTISLFDLVHITSVFLSVSALGAHYARRYMKPYIISPRGSLMREPIQMKSSFKKNVYLWALEKKNLAGAAAIHFTADAEKREYEEMFLPMRKSFVVPNAFDAAEFKFAPPIGEFRKSLGISPEKKIVLFLSRINWKKGLDTLIPAFRVVSGQLSNVVLVIAGNDDGGYLAKTEKMVRENGIEARTYFAGFLSDRHKIGALKESDVFVLPSYSENFGMVVAEAMFAELPVVITSQVAIAPLIQKADAGLVVNKDINEVAFAILKILKNPMLRDAYKMRGKALVLGEFSPKTVGEKMLEAYSEITNRVGL